MSWPELVAHASTTDGDYSCNKSWPFLLDSKEIGKDQSEDGDGCNNKEFDEVNAAGAATVSKPVAGLLLERLKLWRADETAQPCEQVPIIVLGFFGWSLADYNRSGPLTTLK